jgi:DNA-binding HxlR family transcriptional regulator
MQKTVQQRSQCVFSNALDLFGDKWTLLVVRDLFFFNKHEYKEFLASPEAIATNILSDRLKKLYAAGIIDEKVHPENRSRKLYYLTAKGKDLLPILLELAKWGAKYMKDLPAMQTLYKRLGRDENGLKAQVIADIQKWEAENLG